MYAISEVMKIAEEKCREKEIAVVTIFTDLQAVLRRIQSDQPGPGQAQVLRTMRWESDILGRGIPVECYGSRSLRDGQKRRNL